jgi:hypothetical protein
MNGHADLPISGVKRNLLAELLGFCSLEYQTMEKSKNPVILCVIHHRQNHLESTRLVLSNGTVSPGVKRPWREADDLPPTSTEVKNTWIYTTTPPHVFVA